MRSTNLARARRAGALAGFLAFGMLAGCSGGSDGEKRMDAPGGAATVDAAQSPTPGSSNRRERSGPSGGGAPTERKPIDASSTGRIEGVVLFRGEAPERKVIDLSSQAGCVHGDGEVLTESVVVNGGKLQNVFIYVKSGLEGWVLPDAPAEPAVLHQQGCVYRPHVLGLQVGQLLVVENDDNTTHNVHSHARKNEAFNKTQAQGGKPVEWTPEREELGIQFSCDIHPWMKSFVCVVEHPFFAVSGENGTFSIEGLPPGEYALEAWHEKADFGKKRADVTVTAGEAVRVELEYP